jgi:hypothetical protein
MGGLTDAAWIVAGASLVSGGLVAASATYLAWGEATSRPARALRMTHRAIAWLPPLACVLFVAIVLRARAILGYWPHPARSDPSIRGFEGIYFSPLDPKEFPIHWALLWFGLPIAAFSGFFMAGLLTGSARSKLLGRATVPTVVHFAAWFMLLVIVFVDPGQFFDWYMD